MKKIKVCCTEFEEQMLDEDISFAGGGFGYPPSMRPNTQGQFNGKTWDVNGCCGGGCFVLTKLKFCPWCGSKISKQND